MHKLSCLFSVFIVLYPVNSIKTLRFTNLKCLELDRSFATMETCKLKLLSRGIVGINIHVKLHKVPVTNVSVNLSLHKRANGYRPFLYNITFDFCDFMRQRTRYPVFKIFHEAFSKNSNINHTCPFNHDIIVDNYVLVGEAFRLVPLPEGDYMIGLMVGAYNDWKANVKIYLQI